MLLAQEGRCRRQRCWGSGSSVVLVFSNALLKPLMLSSLIGLVGAGLSKERGICRLVSCESAVLPGTWCFTGSLLLPAVTACRAGVAVLCVLWAGLVVLWAGLVSLCLGQVCCARGSS